MKLPKSDFLKSISTAVVITPEGEQTAVNPANGKFFTLEEMYELVNCDLVEFVYLPEDKIMIVDENGWFRAEPKINAVASQILINVGVERGTLPMPSIIGNALIIDEKQTEDYYEDEE